jgi:hypothetical protein
VVRRRACSAPYRTRGGGELVAVERSDDRGILVVGDDVSGLPKDPENGDTRGVDNRSGESRAQRLKSLGDEKAL